MIDFPISELALNQSILKCQNEYGFKVLVNVGTSAIIYNAKILMDLFWAYNGA